MNNSLEKQVKLVKLETTPLEVIYDEYQDSLEKLSDIKDKTKILQKDIKDTIFISKEILNKIRSGSDSILAKQSDELVGINGII